MNYLNENGLSRLWSNIKSNFLAKNNVGKYLREWVNKTYSSPALTIGTSDTNWHKLSFTGGSSEGSLVSDRLFSVDSSHSVFTCQKAGVYAIECGANICGESTGVIGWLYIKNGTYSATKQTNAQYWYPAKSGSHASTVLSVATTITLSAGDTIEVNVSRGDGGALRILGNYISITCMADLS